MQQRDYIGRHRGDESGGCCSSLCRCLARVPCSSFCVFLTMVIALIGFVVSLCIAFYRTRDVINQSDIWPWFLYSCIGVAVGMLVFVSAYLAVASVSFTNSSNKQNICLRVFNCIIMALGIILQFAWILSTILAALPVAVLLMFFHQYANNSRVNLSHYGLTKSPTSKLAGPELTEFYKQVQKSELLFCYSATLVCSAIVTVTLSLILINTAHNYTRLKSGNRNEVYSSRPVSSSHMIGAYNEVPKSTETILI